MKLIKKKARVLRGQSTKIKKETPEFVSKSNKDQPVRLALALPDFEAPAKHFDSAFLELAQRSELPLGAAGRWFLLQLKELGNALELYRRRYRELLVKNPDGVTGWELATFEVRKLDDTASAFRAVIADDSELETAFLESCRLRLGEFEKAVALDKSLPPEQARIYVKRLLSEFIHCEPQSQLRQLGAFRHWQQQERIEEGGQQ
jgi:hypothetical protein